MISPRWQRHLLFTAGGIAYAVILTLAHRFVVMNAGKYTIGAATVLTGLAAAAGGLLLTVTVYNGDDDPDAAEAGDPA